MKYINLKIQQFIDIKLWITRNKSDFFFFDENLVLAFQKLFLLAMISTFFNSKKILFANSLSSKIYFERIFLTNFAFDSKSIKYSIKSITFTFFKTLWSNRFFFCMIHSGFENREHRRLMRKTREFVIFRNLQIKYLVAIYHLYCCFFSAV